MTTSLLFDDTIELIDPDGSLSGGSYWFETLAEGASFGDPQPVEVGIASLMRDGAIVEKTGDGNRESFWMVRVCATDQGALDEGVAVLHRATGKRTTLVFTPPDGYGEARVWDVETSNLLEPNGFDDLAYTRRNQMVFRLRLVCQPFRRSTTLTIDDAGTPPSSGGTLLYNCESTTGWSTYDSSAPVVDTVVFTEGAGSIRTRVPYTLASYSPAVDYSNGTTEDTVTGLSIDTGTGGYLSIAIRTEWTASIPGSTTARTGLRRLHVQVGGAWVEVSSYVAVSVDANGFTRYVWPVAASLTITGLRMRVAQYRVGDYDSDEPYVWYDDIELLPAATTDHQIVKQLTVEGSARTTGSLRISAPSEVVALGQVLAITAPTDELPPGFLPDGERWVSQGTATTDTSSMSGHYYTPATTYSSAAGYPIFDVPANMLTAGPYTMVALVRAESSSLTFGVQAQLRIGSTNTGPTSAAEVSLTGLTTGWQFVTVGTVYLPPLPMQGADTATKVRLLFKGAKMANVYYVPAWQVGGRAVADFSIVDCGSGAVGAGLASSSLWIDSPSTSQPQGGWWRGPTTDRLNAQSAWSDAKKPGVHVFQPGSLTAFLVSTGAAGPTMALEYYKRWL